ncbi:MAG: hypothetical protein IJM09_02455 [Neisseriaceae bacterium]|nr:hypothetical protein [Neisseriaceae bacterium]
MDIVSELETASKWSKINSYVCLFSAILTVISTISGAFFIYTGAFSSNFSDNIEKEMVTTVGMVSVAFNVFWAVFYWICRQVFVRYKQSLNNAVQSLSPQAIEEVCHYQRNVFIIYGAYYLLMIAAIVLVIVGVIFVIAGAMGSVSGAVS